jgi:hypothetical protein
LVLLDGKGDRDSRDDDDEPRDAGGQGFRSQPPTQGRGPTLDDEIPFNREWRA